MCNLFVVDVSKLTMIKILHEKKKPRNKEYKPLNIILRTM